MNVIIEVVVVVDGAPYNLQMIGDPGDALTAHNVGQAVSLCLLEHASKGAKQ